MSQDILTITEAASFQIKDMMKEHEEENAYLRVNVNGGGCSGLSYGMGFAHEVNENDTLFEQHGIKILVDSESAPILKDVKIIQIYFCNLLVWNFIKRVFGIIILES